MENSKYYELTELDLEIGLECEYITSNNQWVKFKIDSFSTIANIVYNKDKTYSLSENWRIKYLDREDIESLGFEFNSKEEDDPNILFYYGNHSLILNPINQRCVITMFNEKDWDYTAFVGTVKNKSELKRLMVQLGIKEVKN